MKAIWKFWLPIQDIVGVPMPAGAVVISAQNQHGALVLWTRVDPNAATEVRTFRIVGTGQLFDSDRLTFIATVQMGLLVWHVHEVTRSSDAR